jgi:predicted aspartyl protease
VLALIDTGSNVTIIHPDVARNFTPVGTIPTQTAAGPIQVDQYAGTVTITGLGETVGAVISAQPTRHHAIIGRDVLRHYRMIYDPLKPEFFLEKP